MSNECTSLYQIKIAGRLFQIAHIRILLIGLKIARNGG